METLEMEIAKWTDILEEKTISNKQIETSLSSLKVEKEKMEAAAAEAIRASKTKDPQFEELCKW